MLRVVNEMPLSSAFLCTKQSPLLSLTPRCPASSSLQSTEDGTEIAIMQWQRSHFHSCSHISTWHILWRREDWHEQSTCTHTQTTKAVKCQMFMHVCAMCVTQRIPLDCHKQLTGKIEAISLLRRDLVWRWNRSKSYWLLDRERERCYLQFRSMASVSSKSKCRKILDQGG